MILSRDAILAAVDLKSETVDVPEWGGRVIVRAMTALQRQNLESAHLAAQKAGDTIPDDLRIRLVAISLVDESGRQLFSDSDIEMLGQKSAAVLDRIVGIVNRLNGIGVAPADIAGN